PVGGARGLERLHHHLHGLRLDSRSIISAWEDGDDLAVRTVDRYVDLISRFLALVVNLIGASVVPVGGGLGTVAPLIGRLDLAVRGRILRTTSEPLLVQARHPADAPLIGAALLARQDARGRLGME
ncbi:MAG: ROK family protein, partial [Janthinobacterium lividum]